VHLDLAQLTDHAPLDIDRQDGDWAAVLVPVLDREDPHLLFTERSPDLAAHAGEMAFPGGGYENEDADLEATALREANEEVGLLADEAEVLARLDDVPGPYGHVVRPYVARVADRPYEPDEYEVVEVVTLSVTALTDDANYSVEERTNADGQTIGLPFFRVDGSVVWGLTGFIVLRFLSLVSDWTPPGGLPPHPLMNENEQWANENRADR
jgi:8-oxo-dGTP pyrophosphatase MutT (NUDIX family)